MRRSAEVSSAACDRGATARASSRRLALATALALFLCSSLAPALAYAAEPTTADGAPAFSAGGLIGSAEASPTPDTTPTPTPTPTPEATPTATFARNASWGVQLHLPAQPADMLAVGFHQADRSKRTLNLAPASTCLQIYNPVRTRRLISSASGITLFQQALRGRGTSNFSSADCAVQPNSIILSPVSGTVTSVKAYRLYGRYRDVRLEILPDGASQKLRVVVLHIQDPQVAVGQHVVGGVTPVATVRHFRFKSAVNRYLPVKYADHAHVQINRK